MMALYSKEIDRYASFVKKEEDGEVDCWRSNLLKKKEAGEDEGEWVDAVEFVWRLLLLSRLSLKLSQLYLSSLLFFFGGPFPGVSIPLGTIFYSSAIQKNNNKDLLLLPRRLYPSWQKNSLIK